MAEYQGVITGIGDWNADINKIQPQLDASYRNWVAGGNAILSGAAFLSHPDAVQYTKQMSGTARVVEDRETLVLGGSGLLKIEDISVLLPDEPLRYLITNNSTKQVAFDYAFFDTPNEYLSPIKQGRVILEPTGDAYGDNMKTIEANVDGRSFVWCYKVTVGDKYFMRAAEGTEQIFADRITTPFTVKTQAGGSFQMEYEFLTMHVYDTQSCQYDGHDSNEMQWWLNGNSNAVVVINHEGAPTIEPLDSTLSGQISWKAYSETEYTLPNDLVVLCKGYVGYATNVSVIDKTQYVYAVFIVNHDENVLDEFRIETSDLQLSNHDNIENEAGEYDLLLYYNGTLNSDLLRYPAKAYQSDTATNLSANGIINSSAVCTTQPIDDSSQKVASTEFVWNVIQKEIAAANTSNSGTISGSDGTATYTYTIEKKANLVVLTVSITDINRLGAACNWFTVPEQYRPAENVTLAQVKNVYSTRNLILQKDGTVRQDGIVFDTITDLPKIQFGYKLN